MPSSTLIARAALTDTFIKINSSVGEAIAASDGDIAIGSGATTTTVSPDYSAISIGLDAKVDGQASISLGQEANTQGDRSMALGAAASVSASSSLALGADARASGENSVALGVSSVADRANAVSVGGGAAGTRQIINVAKGVRNNDATNISQLSPVVSALGGNAKINVDGTITPPEYSINGTTVNTVGDALSQVDTSITNIKNDLSTGAIGLVKQDTDTRNIMVAQDLDGTAMNIAGTSGARVLTGVANGKDDSDAVNISQLSPVVSALGGDAKINVDGTITAPEYSINGTTVNTVGDALSQVDTSITNIHNDLSSGAIGLVKQDTDTRNIMVAQNLDGTAMNIAGTSGARVLTGVANGKKDNDAVTIAQLRAVGVVDPEGKLLSALTYDDISLASARLGGTDGTLLTNVRNGTIAANSRDAVNGGQLHALQQHFENNYNEIKNQVNYLNEKIDNFDPGSHPGGDDNFGSVDGDRGIAVGKGSQVVGDGGTTLGHGTSVLGPDGEQVHNGTAVGENSLVSSHGGTAIGQGSNVTGEGSTAIGQNATATGKNSLALGNNSEAQRENSVSVGSIGNERQIVNVADGVAPTDAVNVNQLNNSIEGMRSTLDHYRRDANGGIASAVALANLPQASLAGESIVSIAGGAYAGQAAMAFGLSTATRNGKWVIKASGSTNTRGTVAGGAGVGYRW